MTLALIDGDVLAYRIGYTTEDVSERIAAARMRETIRKITETCAATEYQIWLSDSKLNWRLEFFPNYKANRVAPKPKHLPFLQNLLVADWGAQVAAGEEADDALGICQTNSDDSIICSIDKDLLQIPGNHYNFVKEEMVHIAPPEGLYRFYFQLLVGDSGDNITVTEGLSCKGVGKQKAHLMLEGCVNEQEMYETCHAAYLKGWDGLPPEEIEQKLLTTGRLVKIRTKNNEIWDIPKF